MSYQSGLLLTIMIFAVFVLSLLGLLITKPLPCSADIECPDGRICPPHWLCCEQGCCAPTTPTARHDSDDPSRDAYSYPWYAQWPVLFVLGILGGIMLCCVWCLFFKRSPSGIYMCSFACCVRRPTSEHDSAGSVYPPPRYSRCGSFHQAPPPYSEEYQDVMILFKELSKRPNYSTGDRRAGAYLEESVYRSSEVTSKPDLYPLVITCGEGDGKAGGNYLMVHYFRNYVIRAPGSLSATSTAESLNSSFICNAANEANSIIPPPYSNYEDCGGVGFGRSLLRSLSSLTDRESRVAPPARSRTAPEPTPTRQRDPQATFRENLITSPVQSLDPSFDLELELIDCEMCCDSGRKPRVGSSPVHRSPSAMDDLVYEHAAYGLRHLFECPTPHISPEPGPCESPPQPTSPTQTSRESTLRRPSDERRHRRVEGAKKAQKTRKSSLYMPLSMAYPVRTSRTSPGARVSSRSAPATPCSSLVPNLLNFTQRVSASRHSSRSSRLEEEKNPLLTELEIHTDHKF